MKKIASKNRGIKLIRKSNDLVEARYKFDIWETRVFTKLLSLIRPEDTDFQPFRIHLRDVIDDFKLNRGNASYQLLRTATDNLLQKVFYVPYETDGAIRERKYPIIIMTDTMKAAKDEGTRVKNEYVEVCIHPEMKSLLLQLKEKFTSYDIENITSLKSIYSLRIYELLKQYERIGRRTLDVEYLKRIFEITTEYPLFANFYQKIIEPAERDINQFTDITIDKIEKVKHGRRVESLLFEFRRKQAKEVLALSAAPLLATEVSIADTPAVGSDEDKLFLKYQAKVVGEFGVSPSVFMNQLKGRTEAQLQKAIRVTEAGRKTHAVKNLAGFFVEALRRDFTNEAEEAELKKKKAAERAARLADLQQKLRDAHDDQAEAILARIRELTSENPTITEGAIKYLRENPLKNSVVQNIENQLGKTLETQDFRDHKGLRQMVIEAIYELNHIQFLDITERYRERIENLQKDIKSV